MLLDGESPELEWDKQAMVGVVVAAKGYPEAYEKGAVLTGVRPIFHRKFIPFMQERRKMNR